MNYRCVGRVQACQVTIRPERGSANASRMLGSSSMPTSGETALVLRDLEQIVENIRISAFSHRTFAAFRIIQSLCATIRPTHGFGQLRPKLHLARQGFDKALKAFLALGLGRRPSRIRQCRVGC